VTILPVGTASAAVLAALDAAFDAHVAATNPHSGAQPFDADLTAIAAGITAAGHALLDDVDATAQRTTLGLGTLATQNAGTVAITGGSIIGLSTLRLPNTTHLTGRNAADSADLNLWRANASNYMDFGTQIYRDDFALYDSPKNWISLRRNITTAPTAGERDHVVKLQVSTKQSGTVSQGRMALQLVAGDRSDVTNITVTGAANNGAGLIRITATAHGYATGDSISVYGVAGTTEANGNWIITRIDANTFDLQGSTFTNAYVSGGTATNRGLYYGMSSAVGPRVDRGGLTGTAQNGDDVACYVAINAGTAKGTDAFYLGHNGAIVGSEWITGFTVDAHCDYGIRLNGTYTAFALDFSAGTSTIGPVRFKNNTALYWRNAADSANLPVISLNASNLIDLGQALSAGTATKAPLKLTAGTNLTTPQAGAIEYNGSVFYDNFAASQRGLRPSIQMARTDAARSLVDDTSLQAIFPAADDALTVIAGMTYRFRVAVRVTTGANSLSLQFSVGGTATFTTFNYITHGAAGSASGGIATSAMNNSESATALTAVTTTSASTPSRRFTIEGDFEVNAAGTLIPQVRMTAISGATPAVEVGSFFECWPTGANPVTTIGAWA
jgi:hypothetical protein